MFFLGGKHLIEIINFFAREYVFFLLGAVTVFLGVSLFLLRGNLLMAILALENSHNQG